MLAGGGARSQRMVLVEFSDIFECTFFLESTSREQN